MHIVRGLGTTLFLIISMLTVSACGFKPLYATPQNSNAPTNRQIAIGVVSAPEEVYLYVVEALRDRIVLRDGEQPKYQLVVSANENAQRLAVQIDATVTRYNYRLSGRYQLVELATGEIIRGRATAVTSYNIVSSQYSTLFAENAAREKAAKVLAEEIERDILLRFAGRETEEENLEDAEADALLQLEEIEDVHNRPNDSEQPFFIGDEPEE
ncbi:MAG: hypothetical protein AAGD92_11825 [Pseudomonadota bacterium]